MTATPGQRQSMRFTKTEVTPKEAADLYHVSVTTIRRWIEKGLPVSRPGGTGHIRILRRDLEAWVAGDTKRGE